MSDFVSLGPVGSWTLSVDYDSGTASSSVSRGPGIQYEYGTIKEIFDWLHASGVPVELVPQDVPFVRLPREEDTDA
jgi:hypothetical protein